MFRDKSYTLINKFGPINWTDSKAEVDSLNSSDSQNDHYLATITSELEQAEIAFQIGEVGINAWLGGNDVGIEGDWRWTEGPEGKANGGTGTPFWSGNYSGNSVQGRFQNWEKMNQTIVLGLIPLTERIIYKLVKGVLCRVLE